MAKFNFSLGDFIVESNMIEGIYAEPSDKEIVAYKKFLSLSRLSVRSLEEFVWDIQPRAVLRELPHHIVSVGKHVPPKQGPSLVYALEDLLDLYNLKRRDKYQHYQLHLDYETLHPFTDGNGRSGRALWLWYMGGIKKAPLGFLHTFYYQSLSHRNEKGFFYGKDGI